MILLLMVLLLHDGAKTTTPKLPNDSINNGCRSWWRVLCSGVGSDAWLCLLTCRCRSACAGKMQVLVMSDQSCDILSVHILVRALKMSTLIEFRGQCTHGR